VDPLLATAIFKQESGFSMNALSSQGAIGIAQLMPDTATSLGVNPYDPLQNIDGGIHYLRLQLDCFAGYGAWAATYAVAAYNAGPKAVQEYGGVPPYRETMDYVGCVSRIYSALISS
jgi:soluble lytic murein transglycosylase-like protein